MPPTQYNNPGLPTSPEPIIKPEHHFKMVVGLVVAVVLLISVSIFAFWAFSQRNDYKENTDKKVQTAVAEANKIQEKQLKEEFAQQEKEPLKSYTTPSEYGSVKVVYPKTWSAYIIEQSSGSNNTPIDGFFNPNYVPNTNVSAKNNFALRIQISSRDYKTELDQYKSQIAKGQATSSPYKAELVKNSATGVRIDGQISSDKRGSIIIIPVRDKVLKIWTENDANCLITFLKTAQGILLSTG